MGTGAHPSNPGSATGACREEAEADGKQDKRYVNHMLHQNITKNPHKGPSMVISPSLADYRQAGREVQEELSVPSLLARIRHLEAELSLTQRAHESLERYIVGRPWEENLGDADAAAVPPELADGFGLPEGRLNSVPPPPLPSFQPPTPSGSGQVNSDPPRLNSLPPPPLPSSQPPTFNTRSPPPTAATPAKETPEPEGWQVNIPASTQEIARPTTPPSVPTTSATRPESAPRDLDPPPRAMSLAEETPASTQEMGEMGEQTTPPSVPTTESAPMDLDSPPQAVSLAKETPASTQEIGEMGERTTPPSVPTTESLPRELDSPP